MSDEKPPAGAAPAKDPTRPVTQPVKAATRPLKAATQKTAAYDPAAAEAAKRKGSRLKAHLMIGIIVSTVVLSALIVIRLVFRSKPVEKINIGEMLKNAIIKAKAANKEIFTNRESKVWIKGEHLTADDVAAIKAELKKLEEVDQEFHKIRDLLREYKKAESEEMQTIEQRWDEIKLWIIDAGDVTNGEKKPPEYAGFYIPLFQLIDASKKAQAELKEIEKTKDEVLAKSDPAEKEAARRKIRDIELKLAGLVEKYAELDDYVKKGLNVENLSDKRLPDIGILREEQTLAQMAQKAARELRSQFRE